MERIKYFVMDVDGTLTDGKIYMGQNDEIMKAFNIKDGCGIKELLPQFDITPIVITARESAILENRCREIGITEYYQGYRQKCEVLRTILGEKGDDFSSVAYIGDDIPDLSCMEVVKENGGIVLCPADAISEIKDIADYISNLKAGEGAVRDSINYIVSNLKSDNNLEKRIEALIELILSGKYERDSDGYFPDGTPYSIQEYETRMENECIIETHRYHIDIQYIIEGNEFLRIYKSGGLQSFGSYDDVNDKEFWRGNNVSTQTLLKPGSLMVIRENQPHMGCICISDSERVKKLVCKIDTRIHK